MDSFYIIAGIISLVYFYLIFIRGDSSNKSQLNIAGKLIWIDKGRKTKPFFNKEYEVLGKSDLMYKIGTHEVLAVEYKHRYKGIYDSDIMQASCAALAARGEGLPVNKILIKTKTTEKYIDLPKSDAALYKIIQIHVVSVRKANNGLKLPATPVRYKCQSCAYCSHCEFSI